MNNIEQIKEQELENKSEKEWMVVMYKVAKRDGSVVNFDINRISHAIEKAFRASGRKYNSSVIDLLALRATSDFEDKIADDLISVEDIQDSVEEILQISGYSDVAKSYILYRKQREKIRNMKSTIVDYKDVVDGYLRLNDWRVKENSTVTYSVGGLILSNSGAVTANYWLSEIYDEEISNAHRNADLHIHDLSMLTGYCAGWSLDQLIKEGLGGIAGRITSKPAKHLSSLCNQMVNFLGIMQNEWAGAQAFSSFDTYLAPFVKADNLSYKEVKQNIESFIFGVNTPSRWGCVKTDTEILTKEGWKNVNTVKKGELIYSYDMNNNIVLTPLTEIVRKMNTSGVMHKWSTQSYCQTVTPEHRCIVNKFNSNEKIIKTSKELANCNTINSMPLTVNGIDKNDINLSDNEIKLASMIYTDGSLSYRDNKIHKVIIFKSKNRKIGYDEITNVLNALNIKYTTKEAKGGFDSNVTKFVIYGDDARKIENLVGQKDRIDNKFLQMSDRQSMLFLKQWSMFDGNYKKFKLQCDNKNIVDSIQMIAINSGKTSHVLTVDKGNNKPTIYVKINKAKSCTPKFEVEKYNGEVWCPNVAETGTAIFRDSSKNVFISGNCQAPFTNITLDWTVPADLAELPAIVGGKEMDFTYKDCQKEMDMINKAFIEVFIAGDADGRGFQYPIPTYSITKDFDWSETENNKLLFEMTAKYGTPYFSNYVNSDMEPSDVRSMCCRLRLDLRELRKKSGGFFGSGESTGSIGVVTINLPRIGYTAKTEIEFYEKLDHLMDVAARSLKIKRNIVSKLLEEGLYPYTKRYLGTFDNHFSTIGLVGMNEACLNANWIGDSISSPKGEKFAKDVLNYMRNRLSDYQEEYGDLYNLEATPAESTSYRLALHDKKHYPSIITASEDDNRPYYTNSTHLAVDYTSDVFEALEHQDKLQTLYTSGTVFHSFLGEKLSSWKEAAVMVKKVAENFKLPYFTLSPTYSICPEHGYLAGEHFKCPTCGGDAEVYSRITGYYRPVQNWNIGKSKEFEVRKEYNFKTSKLVSEHKDSKKSEEVIHTNKEDGIMLFTTETCPNCRIVKRFLEEANIVYKEIDATKNVELAKELGIMQAPTLVSITNGEVSTYANPSTIKSFCEKRA